MLSLTRAIDETITLTLPSKETITIMLCAVCGRKRAKIGITAPESVNIARTELLERSLPPNPVMHGS